MGCNDSVIGRRIGVGGESVRDVEGRVGGVDPIEANYMD